MNKIFIGALFFCISCVCVYSANFDQLYINNGGSIDNLNINGKLIKYYNYKDPTGKKVNSLGTYNNYIIKFNDNFKDLNIIKLLNISKLKHINAISFEERESNLVKFITKNINKYINNIVYIEKIPVKKVFESEVTDIYYKTNKIPMDKTVTADEAEKYKPNDPFFNKQWNMLNQSNHMDIGYLGYRKFLKTTNIKSNKEIVIGVIDIGIFYDYPDLVNRIYENKKEIPNNGKDDDGNGYIDDYKGVDVGHPECSLTSCTGLYQSHHGTLMSSIIASATDNNIDIAGIVPNNVKLLPINAAKGYKMVDVFNQAYEYLLGMKERGVNIVGFNISAGGAASKSEYDYMKRLEQADILVIASAGNENMLIDPMNGRTMENDNMGVYPAKYDNKNIISVGAYDKNGNKSSFSNYGNRVHVYMPGNGIISQPYPEMDKLYGVDGTSPAAAVMSGVIGVAKSLYPSCSNIDLRNFIINNASEIVGKYESYTMKTIKLSSTNGKGLVSNGKLQNPSCTSRGGMGLVNLLK